MPAIPRYLRRRREKVFGDAAGLPLDRNTKARIWAYAQSYNARHKQPGQHWGPITRAFMSVLEVLLLRFHNSKDGRCFPSYERIAERARCSRNTVCEAIKALEAAGILTWVNRIAHIVVRTCDLFGQWTTRRRVIRTSNAYRFRDPQLCHHGRPSAPRSSKSENPPGTKKKESSVSYETPIAPPRGDPTKAQEELARIRERRQPILFPARPAMGR